MRFRGLSGMPARVRRHWAAKGANSRRRGCTECERVGSRRQKLQNDNLRPSVKGAKHA